MKDLQVCQVREGERRREEDTENLEIAPPSNSFFCLHHSFLHLLHPTCLAWQQVALAKVDDRHIRSRLEVNWSHPIVEVNRHHLVQLLGKRSAFPSLVNQAVTLREVDVCKVLPTTTTGPLSQDFSIRMNEVIIIHGPSTSTLRSLDCQLLNLRFFIQSSQKENSNACPSI